MAVKKHALVRPNCANPLEVAALVQYIHMMTEQPGLLPPASELIRQCEEIVKRLARVEMTESEEVWQQLALVEEFFQVLAGTVHADLRQDLVEAVLEKFYALTSDPVMYVHHMPFYYPAQPRTTTYNNQRDSQLLDALALNDPIAYWHLMSRMIFRYYPLLVVAQFSPTVYMLVFPRNGYTDAEASPATCVALTMVDSSAPGTLISAARWMVDQRERGAADEGLRCTLGCMYSWVACWQGNQSLSLFLMAFVNVLEDADQMEMLIDVTLDSIESLFLTLQHPELLKCTADVVFHVLASLRHSMEALEKISPHVGRILDALATHSGAWSRQMLQSCVDIVGAMTEHLRAAAPRRSLADAAIRRVSACLERHMPSLSCPFLVAPAWHASRAHSPASPPPHRRRLGLVNLGNTCYINSVVQALLCTRHFSNHVLRAMSATPYWGILGGLFARLLHSVDRHVHPGDFFRLMKPPSFTLSQQHDSYEYLGYLMELLQSYEDIVDPNFDYARSPPTLARLRGMLQPVSAAEAEGGGGGGRSAGPTQPMRRSVSPRPGGSGGGGGAASSSAPAASKRAASEEFAHYRKRFRADTSFVDNIFGGVLLTRLQCTHCQLSSLSRDEFRDLQLSFPEKPEPNHQQSVQGLLEYFCSKERLYGQNQYKCPECGGLRDAERSVLIETPPKYLVLVIKHFRFDPKLQTQSKLFRQLHYNHTVTLPTVRARSAHAAYKLYAAVVHMGSTLDSGHYYTVAEDGGVWHTFNDDRVTPTREDEVNQLRNSSTPYILFYRRTDLEESVAPSFDDLPPALQDWVSSHDKHIMFEQ